MRKLLPLLLLAATPVWAHPPVASPSLSFLPPEGPVRIQRENASRFATIQANVAGRDLVGFVEAAQGAVAQNVTLPAGYSLE